MSSKSSTRKRSAPPPVPAENPSTQLKHLASMEEEELDEDVFLEETLLHYEEEHSQRRALAERLSKWKRPALSQSHLSQSQNIVFQQLEIDYIIGDSHKELLPSSSGPAAILRIFGVTSEVDTVDTEFLGTQQREKRFAAGTSNPKSRSLVRRRPRSPSPRRMKMGDRGRQNKVEYPERRGTIHTISGGTAGGDSSNSRKRYQRSLEQDTRHSRLDACSVARGSRMTIGFGPEDLEGLSLPHSDPLVITMDVAYYGVRRVLVDSGSSADILFASAFDQMGLKRSMLRWVRTPLQGFGGSTVEPLGSIELQTMLGSGERRRIETINFLVVDAPFAYNAILGRPALNQFEAVASTLHLKVKFPTRAGVGEVRGDQKQARSCYMTSLKNIMSTIDLKDCEDERKLSLCQLKGFSFREMQLATDDFSERNIIGQGGFGRVYRGILMDNTRVAVKRLMDYHSPGGEAAFLREVQLISVPVHKNLLKLIGFCTTSTERILVYPFMQNLSVAYRLRELKPGEKGLDWPTRKSVALGTARGLEYLHEYCNPKIIHRDLKAANILLNDDFEAVLGDFGLAKLVDTKLTHATTQVRGTMGHIAPEYLSTGKSSEKTDVFGYGITLLELVTGQRAIDLSRLEEDEDVLLLDHIKKLLLEKRLEDIVDENLNSFDPKEVEMILQVAMLCTQSSPEDRPTMAQVVSMLQGVGLAERWAEWEQIEEVRNQEFSLTSQSHKFIWAEDYSTHDQEAIQLSHAR